MDTSIQYGRTPKIETKAPVQSKVREREKSEQKEEER
jgi:hypothetical protein